jgi:hypothetical protein
MFHGNCHKVWAYCQIQVHFEVYFWSWINDLLMFCLPPQRNCTNLKYFWKHKQIINKKVITSYSTLLSQWAGGIFCTWAISRGAVGENRDKEPIIWVLIFLLQYCPLKNHIKFKVFLSILQLPKPNLKTLKSGSLC